MERTKFAELAEVAEALGAESGRLKKRAAIAAALVGIVAEPTSQRRDAPPQRASALAGNPGVGHTDSWQDARIADAGWLCLYLAGQAFAEADPRKLNVGGALATKALKAVSGCTDVALTAAYRRHGDMGSAAFDVLAGRSVASDGPALADVAAAFDVMASARTTAVRAAAVEGLLRRASALEAKYLLKLMLNDMRIGVKQSLIEEGIAVAAVELASSPPTSQNRDVPPQRANALAGDPGMPPQRASALAGDPGMGHPLSLPDPDGPAPASYASVLAGVRHSVMLEADLARAVERAFTGRLDEARMRLFHPLGFMLASPVETPEEAVARFTGKGGGAEKGVDSAGGMVEVDDNSVVAAEGNLVAGGDDKSAVEAEIHAFLEDKYDGMRAQVHCGDPEQPGRVAVYSRNREDITESYPEIVEAFAGVSEPLILDGELLGWDFAEGKALPFSVLGQRIGRKRVDSAMRRAVPVVFMAFDLLFEQGELLLPLPLRERRERLEAVVGRLGAETVSALDRPVERKAQGGLFEGLELAEPTSQNRDMGHPALLGETRVRRLMLSPARLVESAEAIDLAYSDARARANEGVMLKAAGSAYQPGRRGLAWVKLKRELATLDVVITGAEFGHGRRAGLLSDYTFAVRSASGELLNVGKAYSGVTDAEILELTAWLQAHTLEDMGHFRTVEPLRVLEVAFNNVMRSDRHASGFALRFPRILRIRDDKPVEEIDTVERVEAIYQGQPDKGRG